VKERMLDRKLSTVVNIPPTVRRAMRKIYLSNAYCPQKSYQYD
jgi:hypothetical protein